MVLGKQVGSSVGICPATRYLAPYSRQHFYQHCYQCPHPDSDQLPRQFFRFSRAIGLALSLALSLTGCRLLSASNTPTIAPTSPSNLPNTPIDTFQNTQQTTQPNAKTPHSTRETFAQVGLTLVGDSDRDGVIAATDLADRQTWQWSRGALIPVNLDDDDRDGQPDALDRRVNGSADVADLGILRLSLTADAPLGENLENLATPPKLRLSLDPAARPYVRLFQRTAQGWQAVDGKGNQPLVWSRDLTLGIESRSFANGVAGRTWSGLVELEASLTIGDRAVSDRLALRVVPWLMLPNTAPVQTLYVTDIPGTRSFAKQLESVVKPVGVRVQRETVGVLWLQDTIEIGYSQFPGFRLFQEVSSSPLNTPTNSLERNAIGTKFQNQLPVQTQWSALNGVRKTVPGIYAHDEFAKSLLNEDLGWFQAAKSRSNPQPDQWLDWYGNLEVSPPVPGFPLGRIYYGNSTKTSFHPDLVAFLNAQKLQVPAVAIDTSWLHIRHVDEILSFIPHKNQNSNTHKSDKNKGAFAVVMVSPQAGLTLLNNLQALGYGDRIIPRSGGNGRTISQLLNDTNWVAFNQRIEREKLAIVRQQLQTEFGVLPKQIVSLPVVFNTEGEALWSNPVNGLQVNGLWLVGDPQLGTFGKNFGGRDPLQVAIETAILPTGLQVRFLNDAYYHLRLGNVHCATNSWRSAPGLPFWEAFSIQPSQPEPRW